MWTYFLLAGGAYLVYVSTQPGVGGIGSLFSGLLGSLTGSGQGLTDAQRQAFESGFARHLTPVQGAATGASAAAPVAGIPIYGQIAVGVAALIGYFGVQGSNDTREDREVFARNLGFRQLGGEVDGNDQAVTTLQGRNSLYGYLAFINRGDLVNQGLNIIGRKDFTGNVAWMNAVLDALIQVRFPFPGV